MPRDRSGCASRRCSRASRAALRAFHDGPAIPGAFDSFRVVETYRQTALERGGRVPDAFEWAHEIAGRIEARRAADAPVPCHNDLLNANFLDDGERLRIVDWEYAGMGDRFFDLANFSINHELDADAERGAARGVLRRGARRQTRRRSSSCASCPTSARRCGASCSRPCPSSTSTSTPMRPSTSSDSAGRRSRRRSATALGLNDEGRLAAPLAVRFEVAATADSVGSANSPSCSSSSRSSSSSVPMRTGPLNQFFADRNHQPPKRSNDPADRGSACSS